MSDETETPDIPSEIFGIYLNKAKRFMGDNGLHMSAATSEKTAKACAAVIEILEKEPPAIIRFVRGDLMESPHDGMPVMPRIGELPISRGDMMILTERFGGYPKGAKCRFRKSGRFGVLVKFYPVVGRGNGIRWVPLGILDRDPDRWDSKPMTLHEFAEMLFLLPDIPAVMITQTPDGTVCYDQLSLPYLRTFQLSGGKTVEVVVIGPQPPA